MWNGTPAASATSAPARTTSAGPPRRRLRPVLGGRAVPVVERPGQDQTDADALRRPDHGLRVGVPPALDVEEVDDGGDPVAEHLGEGERGAGLDAAWPEAARERVEGAIAPAHEVEGVAEPAGGGLEGGGGGGGAGRRGGP